ncbi:MAG: hypothetical protein HY078_05400 [Elusimicrobia bacterium]|nr:hypothetical protein [Elusimicrobiota bacterium]
MREIPQDAVQPSEPDDRRAVFVVAGLLAMALGGAWLFRGPLEVALARLAPSVSAWWRLPSLRTASYGKLSGSQEPPQPLRRSGASGKGHGTPAARPVIGEEAEKAQQAILAFASASNGPETMVRSPARETPAASYAFAALPGSLSELAGPGAPVHGPAAQQASSRQGARADPVSPGPAQSANAHAPRLRWDAQARPGDDVLRARLQDAGLAPYVEGAAGRRRVSREPIERAATRAAPTIEESAAAAALGRAKVPGVPDPVQVNLTRAQLAAQAAASGLPVRNDSDDVGDTADVDKEKDLSGDKAQSEPATAGTIKREKPLRDDHHTRDLTNSVQR